MSDRGPGVGRERGSDAMEIGRTDTGVAAGAEVERGGGGEGVDGTGETRKGRGERVFVGGGREGGRRGRGGREEKKEEDLSGGRGPEGGMEGKGRGKESDADGERKEKRACGS